MSASYLLKENKPLVAEKASVKITLVYYRDFINA
jgi:hypothetical protein